MTPARCPRCGRLNDSQNVFCGGCGAKLPGPQPQEQQLQDLRDYQEYRNRYGIVGIIVGTLLLLLLCPLLRWLVWLVFPMLPAEQRPPSIVLECIAPAVILFAFVAAVAPLIYGRWKIWRRHRWTGEQMRSLDRELQSVPRDLPATAQARTATVQGPPFVLLLVVFALVGLVFVNEYTAFKPLDSIASLLGAENLPEIGGQGQNAAIVAGRYDLHLASERYSGVTQAEQTWSYVFHSNGTYTTYLEGAQQYSGTWSQSGSRLTIRVPANPGLNAAYSFDATVSRDASSFTSGKRTWVKVK